MNLYQYVRSNPVRNTDPAGLAAQPPRLIPSPRPGDKGRRFGEGGVTYVQYDVGDISVYKSFKTVPVERKLPGTNVNEKETRPAYWCHGYTLGGRDMAGGPYSVQGPDAAKLVHRAGYKEIPCCLAEQGDILFFYTKASAQFPDSEWTGSQHSALIENVQLENSPIATGVKVQKPDENKSTLSNVPGIVVKTPNRQEIITESWSQALKRKYGKYRCWSKRQVDYKKGTCCLPGDNELDTLSKLPPG
jgi:hypothetical protein